jgi:aspartyl-tRNA(Asn)/glutamyl-tRNA(Gln) amidotransferase subunit A
MNPSEICHLSASQLSELVRRREVSPVEIVKAHLAWIDSLEPRLNSFITLLPEQALIQARDAEREIGAGRTRGPLHGIPFGLKDLFYVNGIRSTAGTRIFENFIPGSESAVVSKLRDTGAILLGMLNLHPLAYGPTGENRDYGDMHNPWDPRRITGGSSGGSGSAVASGECTFALGTDTGGSVRIPGAMCGVVGLKPTYGRVSRYGIVPLAWSLDHAGPLCRTVEDCALVMNVIAGPDAKDPTTAGLPVPDYREILNRGLRNLRVGVPREYFEVPIDAAVKGVVQRAIGKLAELGAAVSEVSWPLLRYGQAIATTLQMAEATAYHRKLIQTQGDRLDPVVRMRLEAGFFISATDYIQAQRARALFYRQGLDLFGKVDLLAGPTVPVAAFEPGQSEIEVEQGKMKIIPGLMQYTRPFNLTGFPAITLPCGFSNQGLPVGLQLAGRPFEEATVLLAAHAYEQATEWHQMYPPV